MHTARYALALEGNAHFLRKAADAQEKSIVPFFGDPQWEYAPDYFKTVQMSWAPDEAGEDSPWMRLFRNARGWVG